MLDPKAKLRSQVCIFLVALIFILIFTFIATFSERQPECTVDSDCHDYLCVDNVCSCTADDFADAYITGEINVQRPWRCSPDNTDRPSIPLGSIGAIIAGIIGCCAIGRVEGEAEESCQCIGYCKGCGCNGKDKICHCARDCSKCAKSFSQYIIVCGCHTCERCRSETGEIRNTGSRPQSKYPCLCSPDCTGEKGCLCESSTTCMHPVRMLKMAGTKDS
jgi:hypothetical protein